MVKEADTWSSFAWQGLQLTVPQDWNLGRVDGKFENGYARLDDSEIVRAEIEWRSARSRGGGRMPLTALVDRYVENLEKKAKKSASEFRIMRRARFLREKKWLGDCPYETFVWEADYRAYNLALVTPDGDRIVMLRVQGHLQENLEDVAGRLFASLRNQAAEEPHYWCVYGMGFVAPPGYRLEEHQLKSGHIQMTFRHGKHTCQIHRLSLAHMLLKGTNLVDWYPAFFKKQLKDLKWEVRSEDVRGHTGLRISGQPRSRWRQLLRPLPLINPRPRFYLDGVVWHCQTSNKVCVVEHLSRNQVEVGNITPIVIEGYACHEEEDQTQSRGDARLAADA